MPKECKEFEHCWHQIGERCKKRIKYEGLKVYKLVMCCECKKVEKQLEWD